MPDGRLPKTSSCKAIARSICSRASPGRMNRWRGRGDLKGHVVLGFRVVLREAVDEVYADLTAAGYVGLQAPYDAFWGARFAVVEDPDGIAVGLMSPTSPEFRSPPPNV